MRYREVCDRFRDLVAARDACSREWQISDAVVLTVEFDIYEAARMEVGSLEHSRPTTRNLPYVRMVLFDARLAKRIDTAQLTPPELVTLAEMSRMVTAWASGELDVLPDSTSSVIAERLRAGSV